MCLECLLSRGLFSSQSRKTRGWGFLSITCHALSLTATNARPGGTINAFCEPVTQMSIRQSSVRHSMAPRPLIASTTRMAGVLAMISPKDSMSWATPVAVSHRVV